MREVRGQKRHWQTNWAYAIQILSSVGRPKRRSTYIGSKPAPAYIMSTITLLRILGCWLRDCRSSSTESWCVLAVSSLRFAFHPLVPP
ncbi:hypothetical protein VTK56DRAFT_3888 [Thermocarpiscus australiensis]